MEGKSNFRHFLTLLGLLSLYIAAGFLFALHNRDTNNVLHEIFRGKVLAAEETRIGKRILLAGGSNALWGFRSQIIEDESGIPTYNLALLHEAFSPETMRTLITSVVRPEDIVVYSSVSFWNSRGTDPDASKELLHAAGLEIGEIGNHGIAYYVNLFWRYWSPKPLKSTLLRSLTELHNRYVLRQPSPHSQHLNAKGDMKACTKSGEVGVSSFAPPPNFEEFSIRLHAFEKNLKNRGATLILDLPNVLVSPGEKEVWMSAYSPFLKQISSQFQVSAAPLQETFLVDERLFCDTSFHLVDSHAEARSRR